MQLIKMEIDIMDFPRSDLSLTSKIETILENNQEFDSFKSRFYDNLTIQIRRTGDNEEAIRYNAIAIENAEKYNEVSRLAYLLRTKAELIRADDRKQALEVLKVSRELMESMGDKRGLTSILFNLSKLEAERGEYSSSIERILDVIRIKESIGFPVGINALTLSTFYNELGDGENGLEWAKLAESETQHQPSVLPDVLLCQAWSLINMGQLEKAQEIISNAKEPVLKSGMEDNLAMFHFVNGILNQAEGNYEDATSCFEDALDIYSRTGRAIPTNLCLHHLASIEAQIKSIIGPWLIVLEERAHSEDLPGIFGQALILKARVLLNQGNAQEAFELLERVKQLSEVPGLGFLERHL
jgi:tetratricopeptide (TPR) repeat protein